jgi:hypothetical protein
MSTTSVHLDQLNYQAQNSQDQRMHPAPISISNENNPMTGEQSPTISPISTSPRTCQTCPAWISEDQEPWMKQCVGCFKDNTTKRNCTVCERPRIVINDEKWKTVCNGCFKDAALKPCTSCRVPSIKAFETWRTLCKDCYANKNWKRTCAGCKERPIKDDLPAYVKTCTRCYMLDRKKNFTPCPSCPVGKEHLLSRRNGAPSCRDCMRANNLIVDTLKSIVTEKKPDGLTGPAWGRSILKEARDLPPPPPLTRTRTDGANIFNFVGRK